MSILHMCPTCGRAFGTTDKFVDHRCDDADIRRHVSTVMPDPADLRARMKDAGTMAYNNLATAIDQAARAVLLSLAYLLLVCGRWLASQEREIGAIHAKDKAPARKTPPALSVLRRADG